MESLAKIEENTPELIFIVPYRDREQQREFFTRHMIQTVMSEEDPTKYKIYFSHQHDTRSFNRGAMKNIGFLVMKEKYPEHYRDITFVFNDLDTMPFTANFLNYRTRRGVIKHFYGFQFALGGIVSITGDDFEKLNGYPNYWTWGFEDNLLNLRAQKAGVVIDRSQFYPIMDKNILQLKDGLTRLVNKKEFGRFLDRNTEGLSSIQNLAWTVDETQHEILVSQFNTEFEEDTQLTHAHDLRKGPRPFTLAEMREKPVQPRIFLSPQSSLHSSFVGIQSSPLAPPLPASRARQPQSSVVSSLKVPRKMNMSFL